MIGVVVRGRAQRGMSADPLPRHLYVSYFMLYYYIYRLVHRLCLRIRP